MEFNSDYHEYISYVIHSVCGDGVYDNVYKHYYTPLSTIYSSNEIMGLF